MTDAHLLRSPRALTMDLSYLLFTGSLSGLVSILGHSVVWSLIAALGPRRISGYDPQVQIAEAFLHMGCGVVLGFLFWLSWGLAALVAIPWWLRGLAFGGVGAFALLPALANVWLSRHWNAALAALFASRWLSTCLIAGLSCAWSWERAA